MCLLICNAFHRNLYTRTTSINTRLGPHEFLLLLHKVLYEYSYSGEVLFNV